jgi:3-deoxy-D-manno-octulosonic-acid transferase
MYLLYSILLVFWGFLLLPVFLLKAWRRGKSLPGLSQRFGYLPESLKSDGRPTIWFHSCSVGETLSLQPLVQILHKRFPDARFAFSTITKTGQQVAIQRFTAYGPGNTFYFPIDLAFVVRRVLDWIRPTMIVIIDTEIWPNTLNQAKLRGIPVVLANGRISAASFPHYRWARPLMRRVFRNYSALLMQSEEDAERIAQMGAPNDKITVSGNMKIDCDLIEGESGEALARELENCFALHLSNAALIVAGSTHEGEDQILLDAFQRIRRVPNLENTRLLLAPRHPERFDLAARLAQQSGFKIRRRSEGAAQDARAEVLILDTVGELATVYRFATVAFVGGTLVRHGGHSIMEPALYSKAIVIGPSMENFRQIADEFRIHGGAWQISAGPEARDTQLQQVTEAFRELLQDTKKREDLGKAAYSILERNRGATRRTGERIAAIFQTL